MNPQEDGKVEPQPQQTATRAVTKFTAAHGAEVGLPSPEAVNYMMSVAKLLLESSLITKDMGETVEKIRSNALAKMLVGHELGLQPMESLQDIDIVKGKIFMRYPTLINEMLKRGFSLKWIERSNTRAALQVTPKNGMMEPEIFEYTFDDAELAGLTAPSQRTGEPSQYSKRPRVMLSARVVSEAYRSTGGRSNVYTPEEKQEIVSGTRDEPSDRGEDAPNPYHVGVTDVPLKSDPSVPPGEIHFQKNGETVAKIVNVELPQDTNTQADPGKGEGKPSTATDPHKSAAPASPQATIQPSSDLRDELGKALAGGPGAAQPGAVGNGAKSNVVEMPKTQPLPPGAAKPTAMTSEQLKKAWTEIAVEFMPGISPETLARKTFPDFTRGFFNTGKLPTSSPDYPACIAILKSILKTKKAEFTKSPSGLGTMAGASWSALKRYAEQAKWPEDIRDLVFAIAIERYPYAEDSESGSYMIDYLNNPAHIEMLDEAELRMFLVILMKTPKAMLLQDASVATSRSMCDIVIGWKVDLEKATEDQILALLTPPPSTNDAAAQQNQAATTAPAETAAAEADEFDSLFGDLEDDGIPVEDEPNA